MQFSEKLDFIMNVTKTSNIALAHAASVDASYISRLRSGKRLLPKNEAVIRNMASYFARRCNNEYQQKAIADALDLTRLPGNSAMLAEKITFWFMHSGEDSSGAMDVPGGFLAVSAFSDSPDTGQASFSEGGTSIYYGVEGKRRAAACFLSEVAEQKKPQTLLLYSDEETSWMTDDPAFAAKWAALMTRVLAAGNRIRIIHTISRNLDEMLSAIKQWMPLYMSGAIEPYFYPKKRDGIFRHTLFIAPQTAAVVSSSVGEQISCAANVLLHDSTAVASFAEEFNQYLRQCRPLMQIFTQTDKAACLTALSEFESKHADTIIKTAALSALTMPDALLSQILKRAELDDHDAQTLHTSRITSFHRTLKANRFTEIITLPDIDAVKNGSVKAVISHMLNDGIICYTPQEYIWHLNHIVDLLKTYERFHVHIAQGQTEDRYMVYVREEAGVIVAKNAQPPVVLSINESNMNASFWDSLKNIIGEKDYDNPDKPAVIKTLEAYLRNLEDAMRV